MRVTVVFVVIGCFAASVYGWGSRFNRFSPELLSNMGYGGFGNYHHGQQRYLPAASATDFLESILQSEESEELSDNAVSCGGRRCSSNEHCCPGTVCVDLDEPGVGTCLQPHGQREGSVCRRNSDCDSGLVCAVSEGGKVCQQPSNTKKQFNEDCSLSSECDITKGLCCQLLRRHRQAPRKACSYFRDPLVCIGPVAADMIKEQVQHTANEKRITGRAFNAPRE